MRTLLYVAVATLVALVTPSAFAARRCATANGTVYFLMTAGGNGQPGALAPAALPLQTNITADYVSTYDAKTRTSRVTISRIDQSAMIKNVSIIIPCKLSGAVSTDVYANRTQYLQTLTQYSPGSYPGSYLIASTSRIAGFIYPRTITAYNPRLAAVGAGAATNCMSWGRAVATLDLP